MPRRSDGALERPLSGLMLCGVPVETIDRMSDSDFESGSPYFLTAYDDRRPTGTPLLTDGASPLGPGPAPYLREKIISILSRRAEGETAEEARDVSTDVDATVIAELQLSLAESVSNRAGSAMAPPPQVLDDDHPDVEGMDEPFAAAEVPRPPWLASVLALSRARVGIRAARAGGPPYTGGDPVAYAVEASAYWRNVTPFGDDSQARGEAIVSALRTAAGTGTNLSPDAYEEGAARREAERATPDWLRVGRANLAGRVGTHGPQAPAPGPVIGPEGLGALAISRYADALRDPPASVGRRVFVIAVGTVADSLPNMDVMREHEQRIVRRA